jgi:hypothetical protein
MTICASLRVVSSAGKMITGNGSISVLRKNGRLYQRVLREIMPTPCPETGKIIRTPVSDFSDTMSPEIPAGKAIR